MDSGAFSEISINGKYTYSVDEYLGFVQLHQPSLFFNMDYMCEPFVLAKTGLTVKQHQQMTVDNQIKIMDRLDKYDIKGQFAGCIQGWKVEDYLTMIDQLKAHGLITHRMGVGSICRRNSENDIIKVLEAVKHELPSVDLHAFGAKNKILSFPPVHDYVYSSDSMGWSYDGRRVDKKPCAQCYRHCLNCANCHTYMMMWYNRLMQVHDETRKQKTLAFSYEKAIA